MKNLSNDFSNFTPEIFIKTPQFIFILRLILNVPIDEFSEKISMSKGSISHWENKRHVPRLKSITFVLNNFKKELQKLHPRNKDIKTILKRFSRFKRVSESVTNVPRGPGLGIIPWQRIQEIALKGIRNHKRTHDEVVIKEILTNEKIDFEEQVPVIPLGTTRAGTIVVDFLVTRGDIKFAIETTTIHFSNRRFDARIIKLLAHKGFRIRLHCPKLKTIVVINKKNKMGKRLISLLEEAFDFVIINDFNSLISIINNHAGSGI